MGNKYIGQLEKLRNGISLEMYKSFLKIIQYVGKEDDKELKNYVEKELEDYKLLGIKKNGLGIKGYGPSERILR